MNEYQQFMALWLSGLILMGYGMFLILLADRWDES